MTREGRLGFPRPLGDILSQFRPLIPSRFEGAPRNVAAVATQIDDLPQTRSVDLREVQGSYFTDVVLDLKGVDEFSKSSLAFDGSGDFMGGMIRAGSIEMTDRQTRDVINDEWDNLLTEGVNLRFDEDDIDTILREDIRGGANNTLTPHVFFTTRKPVLDEKESPLTTPEIIEVIKRIPDSWDKRFANYSMAPRAGMTGEGAGGSMDVDLGSNVSDLTDRL